MSIKIVANGKIEVNNVGKAYLKIFYGILTVMPEIPFLELYLLIYTVDHKRTGQGMVHCAICFTLQSVFVNKLYKGQQFPIRNNKRTVQSKFVTMMFTIIFRSP
jgi:trans-2-enoyl-CoA reductase